MASPHSIAATSDIEPPSSPAGHSTAPPHKSFLSRDDEDTRMDDGSPEPTEKSSRKSKAAKDKEASNAHQIGKIRHLKKEDGEPLWRVDIQHDFLKAVFDDERKVFTNSYDPTQPKLNFADLYIDTMSRSSKTSKVLRDKLLSDREAAKGMAMVCLLVNMGRMNTTLNFFPEMRAQLRTYHAIPSLQAHQDPHAYKQLQDAPRLKSILKGGAEDRPEPTTLDTIKEQDVPRTNPVNLIFVMCTAAPKIAELHFPIDREFHDLVMKTTFTSPSRAGAFLWLMWFYLESDFTEEGCEENPFGPGVDYGLDVANQGVPVLQQMTQEEIELENIDSPEELEFGLEKQKTRAKILEADQAYLIEREKRGGKMRPSYGVDEGPAILPRIRPSKHESDVDSTRSTPPPRSVPRPTGTSTVRRGAPLKYQIFEGSSPARHGPEGVVTRKPRPPTAHQLAVERNRTQRVEYILDRGVRREHHKCRKLRKQDGAIFRAYKRVQAQTDPFDDSEGEEAGPRNLAYGHESPGGAFREKGVGGFCVMTSEKDNFGEEVSAYAAALRRSTRRLARWDGHENELGVIAPIRRIKPEDEESKTNGARHSGMDASMLGVGGDAHMDDVDLDDMDQTALGDDEDMDDPDRTEIMGDSDGD